MPLLRRRVGPHAIAYDLATSRRLAPFGHSATKPENVVGAFLSAAGLRFRRKNSDRPGSPDFANRSNYWAVFVHGCYWHHHVGCRRATIPRRKRPSWMEKFRANRLRNRKALTQRRQLEFVAVVVWECQAARVNALARRLSRLAGPNAV